MLIIREMVFQDALQMSILEKEVFTAPWSQQDFQKVAEDENAIYAVAEEDGMIIGMCGVRNIVGEGEITNVAVTAGRRGIGIGSLCMAELLRLGTLNGIGAFTLEVRKSNRTAILLYQKFLFISEGIRRNFYTNPTEDALIMWKR